MTREEAWKELEGLLQIEVGVTLSDLYIDRTSSVILKLWTDERLAHREAENRAEELGYRLKATDLMYMANQKLLTEKEIQIRELEKRLEGK